MKSEKAHVGKRTVMTFTMSGDGIRVSRLDGKIPEEYGQLHYAGECVWKYEIEGLWSTCEGSEWEMISSGNHDPQHIAGSHTHFSDPLVRVCEQASQGKAQYSIKSHSC